MMTTKALTSVHPCRSPSGIQSTKSLQRNRMVNTHTEDHTTHFERNETSRLPTLKRLFMPPNVQDMSVPLGMVRAATTTQTPNMGVLT